MRLDADDSRPPYQQLADALKDRIQSGEFLPGSQLPSITALAEQHQVAKGTVQAALRVLRQSGLVVARHGKGVYVRSDARIDEPDVSLSTVVSQIQDLTRHVQRLTERVEHLEQASRRR